MTEREKSIVYDDLLDQARKAGFETLGQAVAKACRPRRKCK